MDEAEMIKPLTPIAMQLAELNIPIPTHVETIREDPTTQYVLNQPMEKQVPTNSLFDTFLGPTKGVVEEIIIEELPQKKRRFGKKT